MPQRLRPFGALILLHSNNAVVFKILRIQRFEETFFFKRVCTSIFSHWFLPWPTRFREDKSAPAVHYSSMPDMDFDISGFFVSY